MERGIAEINDMWGVTLIPDRGNSPDGRVSTHRLNGGELRIGRF